MTVIHSDLIVLGAGPAGSRGAIAAADAGLDVVLIDEAQSPGGQVYREPIRRGRAPPVTPIDAAPDTVAGDALRAAVASSRVLFERGVQVWSLDGRFRVDAIGATGARAYEAPRLLVASGATERVVPFPGWTLPGVIGLAAATILLKSQAMLPGRRVLVAGCGPLLMAVAAKIAAAGGEVAAVVDLASRRDWIVRLPDLARRPDQLRQGLKWSADLLRRRVPVHHGTTLLSVEDGPSGLEAVIGPVDRSGAPCQGRDQRYRDLDCVVVGHGLVPSVAVTRLTGAQHHFDRMLGGWVPQRDEFSRTSVPGLYAAGDCCGIRGALPAASDGYLAGLAAAFDAGRLTADELAMRSRKARSDLQRTAPFARSMSSLMALRTGHVAGIAPDTIVCRCEDVTRAEIDSAVSDGARDVNQVKHFTRCGMGPCQGQMCGDVVGELVATRVGSRADAGCWTARPPLRPVLLSDLIGDYVYTDIPIPKPAPL